MQRILLCLLLLTINLAGDACAMGIPAFQRCQLTLTDRGKINYVLCNVDVQSRVNSALKSVYKATEHIQDASNRCVRAFMPNQTAIFRKEYDRPKLLFEDNFDATDINTELWGYDVHHLLYSRLEEFVLFDDAQHIGYQQDGLLNIVPKLQMDNLRHGTLNLGPKCSNYFAYSGCHLRTSDAQYIIRPPVHSAWIHTRDSYVFRYGRVEIRARLPRGDWLFPYLVLQPVGTQNSQIRIAFARGNFKLRDFHNDDVGGNRLYGGLVIWLNETTRISHLGSAYQSTHFGDEFHVFTLSWKRDKIDVLVDGICYGTITQDLDRIKQKYYLVLGVSVGGHLEFIDIPKKPWQDSSPRAALDFWNQRMQWQNTWNGNEALVVDYVRIYSY